MKFTNLNNDLGHFLSTIFWVPDPPPPLISYIPGDRRVGVNCPPAVWRLLSIQHWLVLCIFSFRRCCI